MQTTNQQNSPEHQTRALNESSIELTSDWLERLRQIHTIAEQDPADELPELVVATVPHVEVEPSADDLPASDDLMPVNDLASPTDLKTDLQPNIETSPLSGQSDVQPVPAASQKTAQPLDVAKFLSNYMDVEGIFPDPTSTTEPVAAERAIPATASKRPPTVEPVQHASPVTMTPLASVSIHPTAANPVTYQETSPTVNRPSVIPISGSPNSKYAAQVQIDESYFDLDNRKTTVRVNRLIDRILEKIPPVSPTSLMFGECESLNDTMFVAVQTVVGLAKRELGPILLVDAEMDSALTSELKATEQTGFCQAVDDVDTLKSSICETSFDGIHFLPCGRQPSAIRKLSASGIMHIISECKTKYRYVCFCGGNLNEKISAALATSCDATYLVIDLAESDQSEVEKTVKTLNDCGARTLGCISLEL